VLCGVLRFSVIPGWGAGQTTNRKTNSATSVGNKKQHSTFECKGSTVKGLTTTGYKQMIEKEGPQTDDMNSISQSAEIVRKKMEEKQK